MLHVKQTEAFAARRAEGTETLSATVTISLTREIRKFFTITVLIFSLHVPTTQKKVNRSAVLFKKKRHCMAGSKIIIWLKMFPCYITSHA